MGNSAEWVEILNQGTGERGRIRRRKLENPSIVKPGLLVEVEPGTKPYLPEMFKDRTFAEPMPTKPDTKEADKALDEED
jgi:hypothetical protein